MPTWSKVSFVLLLYQMLTSEGLSDIIYLCLNCWLSVSILKTSQDASRHQTIECGGNFETKRHTIKCDHDNRAKQLLLRENEQINSYWNIIVFFIATCQLHH